MIEPKEKAATMLLSCLKATELVEKRNIVGLSIGESLRLHVHTSMCKACLRYQRHSALIDRAFSLRNERVVPADRIEKLISRITEMNKQ